MPIASAVIKAKILSNGLRIDDDALEYIVQIPNYKRESFVYNDSHSALGESVALSPQELLISMPDGKYETVVSCVVSPNSSLSLTVNENHLAIHDSSESAFAPQIAVNLLPHPTFWDETDADGVPLGRIVGTCGLCEVNVWLWHDCALPFTGKPCKFCGINSVARDRKQLDLLSVKELSGRDTAYAVWGLRRSKVLSSLTYALKRAVDTYEPYKDHFHLIFISGNLPNELLDLQWKIYVEAMAVINQAGFQLRDLDSTAILMPPNDLSWIQKAHDTGLGKVGFNLEVWHPDLFAEYCPGKATYGRERMLEALKEAVRVFGVGSVWCNFVFGLEPVDELLCGMEYLASLGIVPGANVFHKDRGAQLGHLSIPSTHEIISFYKQLAKLYHTFGFQPFYCEKALRTSLANEAFKGWLE